MVDPTWTPENERDLAELETAAQSIIDKWTGPLPAVVCALTEKAEALQAQVKALQAQVKALLEPAANLQVEYLNLAGALSRLLLAVTLAPQAPMREWHVNNALKGANRALDDAQEVMEDEAFVY